MGFKSCDIEQFNGFGQRLMRLARKNGIDTPELIAEVICNNDEYFKAVKLRNGKPKSKKDSQYKQKDGIKRIVQKHFNEEDVKKVPSAYLWVYSEIFNCSLDYLYGKSKVSTVNLKIADICKKTGLSEKAVLNLCEECDNGDFPLSEWWSGILENDSFYSIPITWKKYANCIVMLSDIEKKADAMEKASTKIVDDEILQLLEEGGAKSFRRLLHEKESSKYGAFYEMTYTCEHILKSYAKEWAGKQHKNYDKLYYQGELDKIKILKQLELEESLKYSKKK